MPLHPFAVHLPIALALLMPVLAAAALLAWWREWLPGKRAWIAVVFLQILLVVGTVVALRTGEGEEERVEAFVAESSLEDHEAAGKRLLIGAAVVLLLAVGALLPRRALVARALALLVVVGATAVTALALQVGKAGGELVYVEGAAQAYTRSAPGAQLGAGGLAAPAAAPTGAEGAEGAEHEDGD